MQGAIISLDNGGGEATSISAGVGIVSKSIYLSEITREEKELKIRKVPTSYRLFLV